MMTTEELTNVDELTEKPTNVDELTEDREVRAVNVSRGDTVAGVENTALLL